MFIFMTDIRALNLTMTQTLWVVAAKVMLHLMKECMQSLAASKQMVTFSRSGYKKNEMHVLFDQRSFDITWYWVP